MIPVMTWLTSRVAIAIYLSVLLIGGAVATGAVSVQESNGNVSVSFSSPNVGFLGGGDSDPDTQKFPLASINKAEWEGSTLGIHLPEDHGSAGLVIEHSSREPDPLSSPVFEPTPRYDGVVEVGLREIVDTNAPAGDWTIATVTGDVSLARGEMNVNIDSTATLSIQPRLEIVRTSVSDTGRIDMKVENGGNAPVHIGAVENVQSGARSEVDETVPVANNSTIAVTPYVENREGQHRCYEVPDEVEIRFVTAPDLEKIVSVDTSSASGRRCVVPT